VCLAELDLELLYSGVNERSTFQRISRYPSSQRDVAVLVSESAPAGDLLACIREAGGTLLKSADVLTSTLGPACQRA